MAADTFLFERTRAATEPGLRTRAVVLDDEVWLCGALALEPGATPDAVRDALAALCVLVTSAPEQTPRARLVCPSRALAAVAAAERADAVRAAGRLEVQVRLRGLLDERAPRAACFARFSCARWQSAPAAIPLRGAGLPALDADARVAGFLRAVACAARGAWRDCAAALDPVLADPALGARVVAGPLPLAAQAAAHQAADPTLSAGERAAARDAARAFARAYADAVRARMPRVEDGGAAAVAAALRDQLRAAERAVGV